jgi:biotin-(acetyl-CoA carboxylase) ligase
MLHAPANVDLPPGFRGHALAPGEDAFEAALRAAEQGADPATMVWVLGPHALDLAVVLAPDEPALLARRTVIAGMAALADALVVVAPPEKPIGIAWPATLLVAGAVAGGGRVALPEGAPDAVPAWLVFGATLRLAWPEEAEPGLTPERTALAEEGFEDFDAAELVGSFARHLLFHVDAWQARGFGAVASVYAKRLVPPGRVLENGDLHQGKMPLAAALLRPSWRDA